MNPTTASTSRGSDIDPATSNVREIREMAPTVRKLDGYAGH